MITIANPSIETEHFLFVLLAGERLAASVSAKQSKFLKSSNPKVSRFLKAQSRQESFHASVFRASLLWLNPKSSYTHKEHPILINMQKQLEDAIDHGRIEESILGLQVMIEELGECALNDLDITLEKYRFGLHKVRRIILNQEKAHHTFGERYIAEQKFTLASRQTLLRSCDSYLDDIDTLLADIEPALNSLNISPQDYLQRISSSIYQALS